MILPNPELSRAVIVGVGSYLVSATLPQIPAVKNNLTDLAGVLTSRRHWGLPNGNLNILSEPAEPSEVATAIAQAADQATDTVIVYLAAHGLVTTTGELVIATQNTNPRWPQYTGLRYSWVREALVSSPVRRKVVIIDSCFSGRAISAMSSDDSVIEGQLDIHGAYILASAPPNATAIALPGERHTAFTGRLIELLRDGLSSGPAYLQLDDIYHSMRKAMIRSGYPQPTQMGTDTVSQLAIVRNAALTQTFPDPDYTTSIHQTVATSEISESDRRVEAAVLICIRMDSYDNRTALDRVDAQLRFIDFLQRSAQGVGLEVSGALRKPFQGGEFLLIPETLAGADRIIAFIKKVRQELLASNSRQSRYTRSRLKVNAIHIPDYESGSQILSSGIAQNSLRALDSAAIQRAAAAREVSFVLMASEKILNTDIGGFSASELQLVPADSDAPELGRNHTRHYLWAPID